MNEIPSPSTPTPPIGDSDIGPFAVHVEQDTMIPMRDGIGLAADIYHPAEAGNATLTPRPVLLERTPYNKRGTNLSDVSRDDPQAWSKPQIARYFASHGYVVVLQDCRGRYASQGSFRKYVNEADDGFDTIAWIAAQSFSDGRVATFGLSYGAHVQSALGTLAPPALAAQFLDSGGFSNAYQGGIRQGGAFELKQATWAYKHALVSLPARSDPACKAALQHEDIGEWFKHMPWARGHSPVSALPEYEDYLFEQWQHGSFDQYWRQRALCAECYHDEYADVPMVHMSSWYDPYARTAINNFIGLSARKRQPVHLVMGPWTHGQRSKSYAGDVDFGPAATLDGALAPSYLELRRRWFDFVLGRSSVDPFARGRVAAFVMGGGSGRRNAQGRLDHGGYWRWSDQWPLPSTREQRLYLHRDRTLRSEPAPVEEPALAFDYDPRQPTPTIGGTLASGLPVMVGGAFDQRDDARFFGCSGSGRDFAERDDVLSFQTTPLLRDAEVMGEIQVHLFVASDCVDTDFTVKLIDVHPPSADYPEGFAMNITDGILRMRYRDSWENPQLMQPGQVYAICVLPFPTANRFCVGHRIRLDIASSNYPHFDLNPNTGEAEGAWTHAVRARNSVFTGGRLASHVCLPIAPLGIPDEG
ncbi:MAG: CocE/NonD family hydrolase [Rhodanobacter sp.]